MAKAKTAPAAPLTISVGFDAAKVEEWLSHAAHSWIDLRGATGEWDGPAGLTVKYDREEDNEGDMKGRATIRRADVEKGLAAMMLGQPHLFGQMLNGNDDMESCDELYQFIIFGKAIYG